MPLHPSRSRGLGALAALALLVLSVWATEPAPSGAAVAAPAVGDLCATVAQAGVHCGPGLGRRTAGGGGTGKVSHAGWPAITGVLAIVDDAGRTVAGGDANDELLGGHGDDDLRGGPGRDVLWGDQHPTGNTTRQHDRLDGGPGRDFLYSSHGTNVIAGGAGNDMVWAYYGHGTINCGPGDDLARVRMNHAYRVRNCERIRHF